LSRFENEILSTPAGLKALMDLSGWWIDKVCQWQPLEELILDMDSGAVGQSRHEKTPENHHTLDKRWGRSGYNEGRSEPRVVPGSSRGEIPAHSNCAHFDKQDLSS
jgi:hypothetical protein